MSRERRVAVTAPTPPARGRRARPAEPPMAPEALVDARRIRRTQLRRAVVFLLAGALLLFGLPVLIHVAPQLTALRVFGVPGAWLAVAVLPYPVMAVLAWTQLASAERTERASPPGDGA